MLYRLYVQSSTQKPWKSICEELERRFPSCWLMGGPRPGYRWIHIFHEEDATHVKKYLPRLGLEVISESTLE